MNSFKLDETKISYIAKTFNVNKDSVKKVRDMYVDVSKNIKFQYLAHVIRTVEQNIRKMLKRQSFQINCIPLDGIDMKFGTAKYYKNKAFMIYYNPALDERQLRIIIAHELGHLILAVSMNREYDAAIEPLSSIFGILTILEKNEFYEEKKFPFQHDSWQNIVSDFKTLEEKS